MEGERKPPASSVREAPAPQPQDTAVPMTDDDVEGLPDLSQETAPDSMVEDYSGTTSASAHVGRGGGVSLKELSNVFMISSFTFLSTHVLIWSMKSVPHCLRHADLN